MPKQPKKLKRLFLRLSCKEFYQTNARIEYFKFLIGTIVASIITFFVLRFLSRYTMLTADTLKFALALTIGAMLSFISFTLFWYFLDNEHAFQYIHKAKGTGFSNKLQKRVVRSIIVSYNRFLTLIAKVPFESIKTTYSNQIQIATVFSGLAEEKFLTTSFDLPSHFYNKNDDYFITMNSSRSKLKGIDENQIPNKARVFICSFEEFIIDIFQNPRSLIDLIKWHLEWHEKDTSEKVNSPIRFLLLKDENDKKQFLNLFSDVGIKDENIIPDFMVVDDKLVYGRIESMKVEDDMVNLKALVSREYSSILKLSPTEDYSDCILNYSKVYSYIYEKAFEPEMLVKILNHEVDEYKEKLIEIEERLEKPTKAYVAQMYKLTKENIKLRKESIIYEINDKLINYNKTLDLKNHYGIHFNERQRIGINFTEQLIQKMSTANKECIALDTADLRPGNDRFLDKWKTNQLYIKFLDANRKSFQADENVNIRRIFVLENKIEKKSREIFHNFLINCINDYHLKIGIVLLDKLIDNNTITNKEILLQSDFVIINIERNHQKYKNALGFKLSKNDEFTESKLNFNNNLIIPGEFENFHNLFESIHSQCVLFNTIEDANNTDKIEEFLNN